MIKLISNDKEIGIEIMRFPDGEVQPVIEEYNRKSVPDVTIITRITNAEELFILIQVIDILKRNGTRFRLKILYLMGARMDRVMSFNRPFTLNIIADIINSFNAESVELVEPHSMECLFRIKNSFIGYTVNNIGIKIIPDTVLVFPDHGAYERYISVNVIESDVVICTKKREESTGKIIEFGVVNPEIAKKYKNLYVIDDLCDRGGTFVATAEMLRKLNPDAKLKINVTHMVNPKGIDNLSSSFDEVVITNSYKDWDNLPKNVKMLNVI
jgi:ribose-phosphate pyrophosphokinase